MIASGTIVIVERGFVGKPVEKLRKGDTINNMKVKEEPIATVSSRYKRGMYQMRVFGYPDTLMMTDDQLLYTMRKTQKIPKWKRIEELTGEDYLGVLRRLNAFKFKTVWFRFKSREWLDKQEGRVFGILATSYIGNGFITKG